MTRRLLSLVVAAALVGGGVVRADEPPRPPEGHPPIVLKPSETWRAPACAQKTCGLCFDPEGYAYQTEVRRQYEERIAQAEKRAESTPWRVVVAAVGVGLAVGATVALVRAR